jgi:hypothetical protein
MSAEHCDSTAFDAVAVRAALAHLNHCHQRENLRLARWAAGDAGLIQAWLAGVDSQGLDLVAESTAGPVVLRVAFPVAVQTLRQAGDEMRRLYWAACRSPD